jgi:hypothetical protein
MLRRALPIAPFLILAAAFPGGCRDSQARSAASQPSSAATSSAAPHPSIIASHNHAPAVSHHPAPSADHSLYHNPDFAVSFHDPAEGSSLLTQPQLDAQQPGAILLATVVIPDDAFPNTTFSEGHLQFVVNPTLDEVSCRELVLPENIFNPEASDQLLLRGITLYWRDRGSIAPGTVTASRDYSGFASGVCYQFFLEATSSSDSIVSRHAISLDLVRVLRPLEKSVSSFDLHPF